MMEQLYNHANGVMFRKADKVDAAALLSLKNESWFGTHTVTYANLSNQEKWLENIGCDTHCPRNLVLIASMNITSTLDVGVFKILNIDWQSRRGEVGWDIFKEYRGKGYGKKLVEAGVNFAFIVMNLRRLDAQILANNKASLKCAIGAGFKKEGEQKKSIYKMGEYIDNILLGISNVN